MHGWNPFARSMLVFNLSSSHFEQLAVRPILSATKTYNYSLAKWLDDKLKPLSCNQYTVIDTFRFADEVRGLEILQVEIEREGSLPFLGTELLNRSPKIDSKVSPSAFPESR